MARVTARTAVIAALYIAAVEPEEAEPEAAESRLAVGFAA